MLILPHFVSLGGDWYLVLPTNNYRTETAHSIDVHKPKFECQIPSKVKNEPVTEVIEKLHYHTETAHSLGVQRPKFGCQAQTAEVIEKLCHRTETASSVKIRKPKYGLQIPTTEVIEQLRYHTETANSLEVQKPKYECQSITGLGKGPIRETIEKLYYPVEICSSKRIEKPLLYCCQFLEDLSLNDAAQALGGKLLTNLQSVTSTKVLARPPRIIEIKTSSQANTIQPLKHEKYGIHKCSFQQESGQQHVSLYF
ncbi:hypothetical protein Y032_0053g2293 [Ancylostoma ceylanicum]|uniref:Uncharacterized protein n=1 Tax=Ancylostoma ceylanicum TaxID=53326 RepID=A0A016U6H8_9BILA|nr:hypothetical protein Y032_0053g2293 [Ancylostoma ceylanicum]